MAFEKYLLKTNQDEQAWLAVGQRTLIQSRLGNRDAVAEPKIAVNPFSPSQMILVQRTA